MLLRHAALLVLTLPSASAVAPSVATALSKEALRSPRATNKCLAAMKNASLAQKAAMALASGKNAPFDAGKFDTCKSLRNLKGSLAINATLFLVTFRVYENEKTHFPMEYGFCLPSACRNADLHLGHNKMKREIFNIILGLLGVQLPAGARITIPTYQLGYPQPYDTVSHLNPSNVEENLKPWGTAATTATIVIGLMVLWTAFSTWVTTVAAVDNESEQRPEAVNAQTLIPIDEQQNAQRSPSRTAMTFNSLSGRLPVKAWSLIGQKGTWTELWKCPAYRPTDCLNGMRVISMVWIVLGHSFSVSEANAGFSNPEDIEVSPLTPDAAETTGILQVAFGAEMGVDTFFFISGFLLSFLTRSRSAPIVLGTVLRYFRIVPSVAFMLVIYSCITPYMMYGPFAPRAQESILRKCVSGPWWTNIIFTMNFIPRDPGELCAGWTWYLGNDFIFAIVGLCLINVWKRHRKLAWAAVLAILAGSVILSIWAVEKYKIGTYILGQQRLYTYNLYSNPLHRIPAFLIGFVLPWVLQSLEQRGMGRDPAARKTPLAQMVWLVASMLAVAVMACCVFLVQSNWPGGSGSTRKAENWSQLACDLFVTFVRPIWTLAVAAILCACYYGYLPILDSALSHRLWHPWVKLTYGAYLLHPIVVKTFAGNMVSYFTYSVSEVTLHAFCHAALSYAAAMCLWCLVEKPFATLVEAAMPKPRASTTDRKPSSTPLAQEKDAVAHISQVSTTVSVVSDSSRHASKIAESPV
jgi:peptidoglycan/LPS O-acetylase OafA/YrhL